MVGKLLGRNPFQAHPAPMRIPATPAKYIPSLEGLRGIASAYVAIHHAVIHSPAIMNSPLLLPLRFGIEAVLVFFILSGFVICHSTEKSQSINWKTYSILRIRRIYPVFLIALVLSYAGHCLSRGNWEKPDLPELLGNIFMLQDINKPGIWVSPFHDNGPLWSLSYEMWFYALYVIIMCLVPKRAQLLAATVISCGAIAAGEFQPNAISNFCALLLIWWSGVHLAREYRETGAVSFRGQFLSLLALSIPTCWYAAASWWRYTHPDGTPIYLAAHPFVEFRLYFLALVSVAVLPLLVKMRWIGWFLERGIFMWLGKISFAIYLFHMPVIKWELVGMPPAAVFLVKTAVVLLLAWLAEGCLQPWINRRTARLVRP